MAAAFERDAAVVKECDRRELVVSADHGDEPVPMRRGAERALAWASVVLFD
jgi:hypothetical protein